MSFRDNLQHLRATRNMTQEQLAMLLGVSRQSVTKWEAEKSYPEMDKLIKICQLFGCTLDDLVTGDLTQRPSEEPSIPGGPAADVCGYDEHARDFATRISTGTALCVLSVVPTVLLGGQVNVSFGVLSISDSDTLEILLLFALIATGCAFLIPAGLSHAAFKREHPYIEDFYTAEDRHKTRELLSGCVTFGVILVLAGVGLIALLSETWGEGPARGAFLALVAIATWLFVWGGMTYSRLDIDAYNNGAAEDLSDQEIDALSLSEEERIRLRQSRDQGRRIGRACEIIMLVATIIGLAWLFLGRALTPADADPAAVSLASYFWLSWVFGGIACAIAVIVLNPRP